MPGIKDIASWFFDTGISIFNLFSFDLGDFQVNCWSILFGGAIMLVLIDVVASILHRGD